MKKVSLIILAFCMLISCKKEDKIPTQLLVNTDLESANMSVWFSNGTGSDFNAYRTNEDSFSPSYSLKIERTTLDYANYWYWGQLYEGEMPFGEVLTLTARIKGVNLSGNGISIAIRADADTTYQFATTQYMTNISGTFDWAEYSVNLSDLSIDATKIFIFLVYLNSTTGTIYFDDITLTHK
jgi:hypothetical protein